MQYKQFRASLKAPDDQRFVATITTGDVDRDREVVVAKGLRFDKFMSNPVVMFGHNHAKFPIGKATAVRIAGASVIAEVEPAPTDRGAEAFKLIQGGFLNAVSIGFSADADGFGPPTEKEISDNPAWNDARNVYRSAELLEFSVVNVPSNPSALITAVSKGELTLSAEMTRLMNADGNTLEFVQDATLGDEIAAWVIECRSVGPEQFNIDDVDVNYAAVKRIIRDQIAHKMGRMVTIEN